MEGFKKPDRTSRGKFSSYLYLDAEQTVDSLSALEGGLIEELRSLSAEDSGKGGNIGGGVRYGLFQAEARLSKDQRARREEDVLLKRTGYSRVTTLLDKLEELGVLGTIEPGTRYSHDIYEQLDVGELYRFNAGIRLHPFHQFVSVVQGWEKAREDYGVEGDDDEPSFADLGEQVEITFYGRKRQRKILAVFADMEGAEPGYKVVMPLKKDHILVDLDEFSGEATFVAQVQRKVAEGQVVPAARLVRSTPIVTAAEQQVMTAILPALQQVPGTEDIGLDTAEEDLLLRKPAVIMKPLCIYRG
jgi:hypothetical protein